MISYPERLVLFGFRFVSFFRLRAFDFGDYFAQNPKLITIRIRVFFVVVVDVRVRVEFVIVSATFRSCY